MKPFADLTKKQKQDVHTVYLKNSNDSYTLLKYFTRRGLKAFITRSDSRTQTVNQEDIYLHPYYPDKEPIAVKLVSMVLGNDVDTEFRFKEDKTATIDSTWRQGGSKMILHIPMMYENPDVFKPLYVL